MGEVLCILESGPTHHIRIPGRIITFEWHPYCGPTALNRAGDPAGRQPGRESVFWEAVTTWDKQGRRVDADGLCIWDKVPPEIARVVRIGKRTLLQHPKDCDCGKCEDYEIAPNL